jgi:Zn-dependent metalloprotease
MRERASVASLSLAVVEGRDMNCRNPIHCLVPDYVLREVAKRGGVEHRESALDTLGLSSTLRAARTQAEARRAAIGPPRPAAAALKRPQVNRLIRNAANGEDLNSPIVRQEGEPKTGDDALDEAFEYFGTTWDFWFEVYARNSIDGAGMTLDGVVHYSQNFDNAFWDGDQMIFGDGSGQIFTRLTQSLSVCAHELGHGVIQFDGPLDYQGESGALNEHYADAFGAMVDQWRNGDTAADADWLIGKEILAEGVNGKALRSMKEPGTAYDDDLLGTDPQPAHMDDFVETTDDNGGVHINSGIPNKAFHELAVALGEHSWEAAGRIWYTALGNPQLRATSGFRRFARLTQRVASQLYGASSKEVDAVEAAWDAVGIPLQREGVRGRRTGRRSRKRVVRA